MSRPTRGDWAYPIDPKYVVRHQTAGQIADLIEKARLYILELQVQVDAMRPIVERAAALQLRAGDKQAFYSLHIAAKAAIDKANREDGQ